MIDKPFVARILRAIQHKVDDESFMYNEAKRDVFAQYPDLDAATIDFINNYLLDEYDTLVRERMQQSQELEAYYTNQYQRIAQSLNEDLEKEE